MKKLTKAWVRNAEDDFIAGGVSVALGAAGA